MNATGTIALEQLLEEVDKVPREFLPALLRMVQAFRESVALPTAEDSFRQAWKEARRGEIQPLSELWEGIDAE